VPTHITIICHEFEDESHLLFACPEKFKVWRHFLTLETVGNNGTKARFCGSGLAPQPDLSIATPSTVVIGVLLRIILAQRRAWISDEQPSRADVFIDRIVNQTERHM
jgi:hypothetical protein